MNTRAITIREALQLGRQELKEADSPALDARLLLAYLLQVDQTFLVAHDETILSVEQTRQYRALLARAAAREPIPYLIGEAPFYGRSFHVSPAVLIPRPDTELLVDAAVKWANAWPGPLRLADIGVGSGCVALTLARLLPQAAIAAVDISPAALAVARQNAAAQQLAGRVHFYQGHLMTPLPEPPDLIVANLPYIADPEWTMLDDGVKWYEPDIALKGGSDGLALIRELLDQATTKLADGGAIFLEIGWLQGAAARSLAQAFFPQAGVSIIADLAGRDRVVAVETRK